MLPIFQAMFLKLTEAQRERFLEFLGEEDTYEAMGICRIAPHLSMSAVAGRPRSNSVRRGASFCV